MYLARIELSGFKSFADKTVIEFDKGMTAIVGPNGSGKSNFSEAIRWVLGEQSARSLRGNRMEDVIFNGSQDRKPVNLAKVTLVLNNEDRYLDYDFSEISVSRSYNRNGDSHYYINNEQVRLRDIVDLFLDSGLGRNSFAMISQGQVEQIFLSKPEERRTIFEEAAGVQRYQHRKTEASRKLEKSTENLSRVRDIVHELETQLKPLETQSKTAKKYLEKRDRLKSLEIALYTHQIANFQEDWTNDKNRLKELMVELANHKEKLETYQNQIVDTQQAQESAIIQLDDKVNKSQNSREQIEQLKAKIQLIEQQMSYNEASIEDRKVVYNEQVEKQEKLNEELEHLTEITSQHKKTQANNQEKIRELSQQREDLATANEEQVERLRDDLIDWYQKEATARNQISQSEQELEKTSQQESRCRQSLATNKTHLEETKIKLDEASQSLEKLKVNQFSGHSQLNDKISQLEEVKDRRESMQQIIFQQERKQQQLEAKVHSLRQMDQDYVGFYQGVRSIMKAKNNLRGIEGTVADLIEIAKEHQVAIETALGASLQHIVVEDDQAARQAIQYLRQERGGRATFLPRTNIRSRYLSQDILNKVKDEPGFIAIASQLVQTDKENQAIVNQLLGTTVIADEVKSAQKIAKKANQRVKIVTLDGEVIMPGGAITGGRSKQQTQSMLDRRSELKEANHTLTLTKEKMVKLENEWSACQKSEQILNDEMEVLRELSSKEESELYELELQVKHLNDTLKTYQQEKIILTDEYHQLKEYEKEIIDKNKEGILSLKLATDKINETKVQLEQLTMSEDDRKIQLNHLDQELNELKMAQAVVKVELKQAQTDLDTTQQTIEEIKLFIEQYHISQSQKTTDQSSLSKKIERLSESLEAESLSSQQLIEEVEQLRIERQNYVECLKDLEENERKLNNQVQDLYQRQAKLEAQIEKNESLIDSQLNYLNQEYQLSFEAALQLAEPIEDREKVAKEVKTLKQSIHRLGPVNLNAIEEYEVINERYLVLTQQEEDLLTAMSQLEETMEEMDHEVIKRFGETFEAINLEFQHIFRQLFNGGEAYLELTDPDDFLTTGVEIIAQPPGKKMQSLGLLSGGERALTAIALLFSILVYKPAPFVVLDEVEAALDDANVYRYGDYIQSFTDETQFIVITHRKGTMESANRLYGVTMEESGVSKLASVKLSDAEESIS